MVAETITDQELDSLIKSRTDIDTVPIDSMLVPKYGRELSISKVQRLVRNFDIDAIGIPFLSLHSSGEYAIIDGQHRIAAARMKGFHTLKCLVFIDITYEQEASLYVKFATVNKQTARDRFKAKVEARDLIAVDIVDLCEQIGLVVSTNGQIVGGIQAVGTLEKLYEKHGRAHLRDVLATVYRVWGDHIRAYNSPILEGLSAFILRYEASTPKLDWNRLITCLKNLTPDSLLAKSSQLKGILSKTESNTAVGQVVLIEYNKNLRTNKLSEWTAFYIKK